MTCCFSVGHFHIHLPSANYVCYASYLAVPSIIAENKNCFNIGLCSRPNYKRDCEEWNLKLHFFTAPWTATTIQLKNTETKKTALMAVFWCRWPDLNRYGRNDRGILSPLCLPIPPHRQIYLVTRTRIELVLPPWKGGVLTAWPPGQIW